MRRDQLEHIIRAAAEVTGEREFIIIGSQAILGQYPNAPAPLLLSMEADLYVLDRPDLSDWIDGSLGRSSQFDRTFGYHADGVEENTATLPAGWKGRLTAIHNANTNNATGWCIDAHDIAIAKYVAGREKDLRYNGELWKAGLLDAATINQRLVSTAINDEHRKQIAATIRGQQKLQPRHGRDESAQDLTEELDRHRAHARGTTPAKADRDGGRPKGVPGR